MTQPNDYVKCRVCGTETDGGFCDCDLKTYKVTFTASLEVETYSKDMAIDTFEVKLKTEGVQMGDIEVKEV